MAYDPYTYLPGDAWESIDFMSRALTAPKIVVASAAAPAGQDLPVAGVNMTKPSYFEFRQGKGDEQHVQISVGGGGGNAFSVALDRSFDNGVTWQIVETYTAATEKAIQHIYPVMLRLRVVTGASVSLALRQQLA